jgi:aminomethyltransferase
MVIRDGDGAELGAVTSGTLSPSLDEGIGMGYVRADHAAADTRIVIDVRGRLKDAVVALKPLLKKES